MSSIGFQPRPAPLRIAVTLLASAGLVASFVIGTSAVRAAHSDYAVVESTGTITPGTTEIGLAGEDDEFVVVVLPFPISFYGTTYTSAAVSSNGNVQFDVANADSDYDDGECLPEDDFGPTVFGYFGDILLEDAGDGVFSAVTGAAPNRQFILEWRGHYFEDDELPLNFEIIFYESSDTITVIYATSSETPSMFMVGVQEAFDGRLTQWDCGDPLADVDGVRLDFGLPHGTLQFDPASYTVTEDAGNAFVTVTRTGGSEGQVTVDVTATGGTASAVSDYAFTPTTLTFADGETSRTFGVSIVNDTTDEPDETITLGLSNPTGFAALGAASAATVTITDNDGAPSPATPAPTATPATGQLPNTAGTMPVVGADGSGLVAILAIGLGVMSAAVVLERRRRAA